MLSLLLLFSITLCKNKLRGRINQNELIWF